MALKLGEVIEPVEPSPPPTGTPAADREPAPVNQGTPAGAGEVLSMTEIDGQLAEAAEYGTKALQDLWITLSSERQKFLKAALDRRHKPRAADVDRARDHADTELSSNRTGEKDG